MQRERAGQLISIHALREEGDIIRHHEITKF